MFTRENAVNITLLLLRIVAGIIFIQAAGFKIFGWFGGLPEFTLTPLLLASSIIELVGAPLIILGLFHRTTSFILAGEMAVAYYIAHLPFGIWPIENNGETAILLCFVYLFFCAFGPGVYSLDHFWRKQRIAREIRRI